MADPVTGSRAHWSRRKGGGLLEEAGLNWGAWQHRAELQRERSRSKLPEGTARTARVGTGEGCPEDVFSE